MPARTLSGNEWKKIEKTMSPTGNMMALFAAAFSSNYRNAYRIVSKIAKKSSMMDKSKTFVLTEREIVSVSKAFEELGENCSTHVTIIKKHRKVL